MAENDKWFLLQTPWEGGWSQTIYIDMSEVCMVSSNEPRMSSLQGAVRVSLRSGESVLLDGPTGKEFLERWNNYLGIAL